MTQDYNLDFVHRNKRNKSVHRLAQKYNHYKNALDTDLQQNWKSTQRHSSLDFWTSCTWNQQKFKILIVEVSVHSDNRPLRLFWAFCFYFSPHVSPNILSKLLKDVNLFWIIDFKKDQSTKLRPKNILLIHFFLHHQNTFTSIESP